MTDSEGMNTLPDPRSPSPSTPLSRSDSTASGQHPDLSNEVQTLSIKLVNAINHQTNLDDSLQGTRHDLEIARQRIAQLELAAKKHQDLISGGLLVNKDALDSLNTEKYAKTLQKDLEKEQKLRVHAESERRKMEQEVESLTAALFEEANGMVVDARKETEASEKRTEQLRSQLKDAEVLLHSHQEQLQDLKAVVEKISSEKDENESNAQISTAPSTPGMGPHDKMSRIFETTSLTPATPGLEDTAPDQPLKFSHLLSPVLRHDLTAYEDFKTLIKNATKATPAPSRVASGSYGSINVMGLATGSNKSSHNSSPATPNFPSTLGASALARDMSGSSIPALKDTSVFKRALAEDIEPTLRLDIAPGVNWMAKRTIMTSIISSNLVVEPMPPPTSRFRGPVNSCSLCGENRKPDQYARRHRFRTSEAEDAQRYPLCDHCLGRVRMSCDYIAFLRMIRDGHWRAESDDEINAAWEESVKLRERMFWQRIGGGVVPTYLQSKESPRSPNFSKDVERPSEESQRSNPVTIDPFKGHASAKRVSIGNTMISPGGYRTEDCDESPSSSQIHDEVECQLHNEMRGSTGSKSSGTETVTHAEESPSRDDELAESAFNTPAQTPSKEKTQRLSLTIPGAFE
ncbi:Sec2p-domain-containing protein [Tothia fuscella]|uniref:Sec2p-domain-containing protein n=1 Tax=Tothia fuscella TaxID=1048955 RepID=A0A9P4P379_9PEZI|nr:Sec2p-domain-containing protein [Tothia fuscella]